MKAYLGSGGIAPLILNLGTRWKWVVSFTPQPPYSVGNTGRYPFVRTLGGSNSRSGRGGEEKNPIIVIAANWTRVVQPVA
jgi:hypothetical protein